MIVFLIFYCILAYLFALGIMLCIFPDIEVKEDKAIFSWIFALAPLTMPIALGYTVADLIDKHNKRIESNTPTTKPTKPTGIPIKKIP